MLDVTDAGGYVPAYTSPHTVHMDGTRSSLKAVRQCERCCSCKKNNPPVNPSASEDVSACCSGWPAGFEYSVVFSNLSEKIFPSGVDGDKKLFPRE